MTDAVRPIDTLLGDIMLDLIFIAAIAGFFAVSIAYAHACDRL